MWDNNTPLQLLNTMPNVLEKEHLEKLQMLLEADKYKNQLISGCELCGMYAPFCNDCDKSENFPCAVSYVNFMKAQGMDIDISRNVFGQTAESFTEQTEIEQAETTDENNVNVFEKKEKTKIRIAIARKKIVQ